MKYLVLIPDGMADEPIEALGGRTPMEAAHKPTMDLLAKSAIVGTVSNVPAGMVPESDTANMAILSFDPKAKSGIERSAARLHRSRSVIRQLMQAR